MRQKLNLEPHRSYLTASRLGGVARVVLFGIGIATMADAQTAPSVKSPAPAAAPSAKPRPASSPAAPTGRASMASITNASGLSRTGVGPVAPLSSATQPRVYAPTKQSRSSARYPWKTGITATIFWVGEAAGQRNPVCNTKSSWDVNWMDNFGGTDDPDPKKRAYDFRPAAFIPRQNPFYIALPYNDVTRGAHKPEASQVIPWFKDVFQKPGHSVLKGRWLAIRFGNKICYAQWEDCGPWNTIDHEYVFGNREPRNLENGQAGIDISPAVRDFLGMRSGDRCDWRFVEIGEVPDGPWRKYGENNPFAMNNSMNLRKRQLEMEELHRKRDEWYRKNGNQLRNQ